MCNTNNGNKMLSVQYIY